MTHLEKLDQLWQVVMEVSDELDKLYKEKNLDNEYEEFVFIALTNVKNAEVWIEDAILKLKENETENR